MNELVINVKGMMCGGCENRIKNAVSVIDGVDSVVADHNTGKVKVVVNNNGLKEIIENKIEDIGFEVVKG